MACLQPPALIQIVNGSDDLRRDTNRQPPDQMINPRRAEPIAPDTRPFALHFALGFSAALRTLKGDLIYPCSQLAGTTFLASILDEIVVSPFSDPVCRTRLLDLAAHYEYLTKQSPAPTSPRTVVKCPLVKLGPPLSWLSGSLSSCLLEKIVAPSIFLIFIIKLQAVQPALASSMSSLLLACHCGTAAMFSHLLCAIREAIAGSKYAVQSLRRYFFTSLLLGLPLVWQALHGLP